MMTDVRMASGNPASPVSTTTRSSAANSPLTNIFTVDVAQVQWKLWKVRSSQIAFQTAVNHVTSCLSTCLTEGLPATWSLRASPDDLAAASSKNAEVVELWTFEYGPFSHSSVTCSEGRFLPCFDNLYIHAAGRWDWVQNIHDIQVRDGTSLSGSHSYGDESSAPARDVPDYQLCDFLFAAMLNLLEWRLRQRKYVRVGELFVSCSTMPTQSSRIQEFGYAFNLFRCATLLCVQVVVMKSPLCKYVPTETEKGDNDETSSLIVAGGASLLAMIPNTTFCSFVSNEQSRQWRAYLQGSGIVNETDQLKTGSSSPTFLTTNVMNHLLQLPTSLLFTLHPSFAAMPSPALFLHHMRQREFGFHVLPEPVPPLFAKQANDISLGCPSKDTRSISIYAGVDGPASADVGRGIPVHSAHSSALPPSVKLSSALHLGRAEFSHTSLFNYLDPLVEGVLHQKWLCPGTFCCRESQQKIQTGRSAIGVAATPNVSVFNEMSGIDQGEGGRLWTASRIVQASPTVAPLSSGVSEDGRRLTSTVRYISHSGRKRKLGHLEAAGSKRIRQEREPVVATLRREEVDTVHGHFSQCNLVYPSPMQQPVEPEQLANISTATVDVAENPEKQLTISEAANDMQSMGGGGNDIWGSGASPTGEEELNFNEMGEMDVENWVTLVDGENKPSEDLNPIVASPQSHSPPLQTEDIPAYADWKKSKPVVTKHREVAWCSNLGEKHHPLHVMEHFDIAFEETLPTGLDVGALASSPQQNSTLSNELKNIQSSIAILSARSRGMHGPHPSYVEKAKGPSTREKRKGGQRGSRKATYLTQRDPYEPVPGLPWPLDLFELRYFPTRKPGEKNGEFSSPKTWNGSTSVESNADLIVAAPLGRQEERERDKWATKGKKESSPVNRITQSMGTNSGDDEIPLQMESAPTPSTSLSLIGLRSCKCCSCSLQQMARFCRDLETKPLESVVSSDISVPNLFVQCLLTPYKNTRLVLSTIPSLPQPLTADPYTFEAPTPIPLNAHDQSSPSSFQLPLEEAPLQVDQVPKGPDDMQILLSLLQHHAIFSREDFCLDTDASTFTTYSPFTTAGTAEAELDKEGSSTGFVGGVASLTRYSSYTQQAIPELFPFRSPLLLRSEDSRETSRTPAQTMLSDVSEQNVMRRLTQIRPLLMDIFGKYDHLESSKEKEGEYFLETDEKHRDSRSFLSGPLTVTEWAQQLGQKSSSEARSSRLDISSPSTAPVQEEELKTPSSSFAAPAQSAMDMLGGSSLAECEILTDFVAPYFVAGYRERVSESYASSAAGGSDRNMDWLNLPPYMLKMWERVQLQPYSPAKDIDYLVLCPEKDWIFRHVSFFLRNLSAVFEACNLGFHRPLELHQSGGSTSSLFTVPLPPSSNDSEGAKEDPQAFTGSSFDMYDQIIGAYKEAASRILTYVDMSREYYKKKSTSMPNPVLYILNPFMRNNCSSSQYSVALQDLYRSVISLVRSHPSVVVQVLRIDDIISSINLSARLKNFAFSVASRVRTVDKSVPEQMFRSDPLYPVYTLYPPSVPKLYEPPYILSQDYSRQGSGSGSNGEELGSFGTGGGRQDEEVDDLLTFHCCYMESEDGLWLVSCMTDTNGELLETCMVSLAHPNKVEKDGSSSLMGELHLPTTTHEREMRTEYSPSPSNIDASMPSGSSHCSAYGTSCPLHRGICECAYNALDSLWNVWLDYLGSIEHQCDTGWQIVVCKRGVCSPTESEDWAGILSSAALPASVRKASFVSLSMEPFMQIIPMLQPSISFGLILPAPRQHSHSFTMATSILSAIVAGSPSILAKQACLQATNANASASSSLRSRFRLWEIERDYGSDCIGVNQGMVQGPAGPATPSRCPVSYSINVLSYFCASTENNGMEAHSGGTSPRHFLRQVDSVAEVKPMLRDLVRQYHALSWLTMDLSSTKRRSFLPHHAMIVEKLSKVISGISM